MSCYVTIDVVDPNIEAIKGLAPGLEALTGLGLAVAHHGCPLPALHTTVHWHQDSLI